MRGQSFTKVMNDLYKYGWQMLDSEDGWARFMKYDRKGIATSVLEISYVDDVIVDTYKYSY